MSSASVTPAGAGEGSGNVDGSSTGRALVLCPLLRGVAHGGRAPAAVLEEAVGLARAIDLEVVHAETLRVMRPQPGMLLGRGTVDTFKELIEAQGIGLTVVDSPLSPVQQRNLEKAWNCKVIDRTGLILEIFGERARTREGQLQVELAALTYQRSRLVRSWTHLERQRGGFGFLGGPGESQLEMDRRLIGDRIIRIKRELEDVKRTRGLHRKARQRVPYPVVALVGYTNAGKSTLFNRLTRAKVTAKDLLFATLDPTMRAVALPTGRNIILSDTVGFISDLPTDLVAAFRATLEEVEGADVILHVRDISHPDTAAQQRDVEAVLRELGLGDQLDNDHVVEVLNKTDLLDAEARRKLAEQTQRASNQVLISAATGEGVDQLLDEIDRRLASAWQVMEYRLSHAQGGAIAWLYDHGEVLERRDEEDCAYLRVRLDPADASRFERMANARR